jgi:hypothetical protein
MILVERPFIIISGISSREKGTRSKHNRGKIGRATKRGDKRVYIILKNSTSRLMIKALAIVYLYTLYR